MDNWFQKRERYRPDYNILANALTDVIEFKSVLDVGSANGFLLDFFHAKGKQVAGVELSPEAKPFMSDLSKGQTIIGDITQLGKIGRFDIVTCVEVAEHIPEDRADLLVRAIFENARDYIYFTAATPFQGGRGHVNCQPHFYWLNKFRKYDIYLDFRKTESLLQKISDMKVCYWIPLNSLILKRW